MTEAVRRFGEHEAGAHSWMLGRFVVPCARLTEFARVAEPSMPAGRSPGDSACSSSSDAEADLAAVAAFNASHRGAVCDTVECRAATADEIARLARITRGGGVAAFVEIPSLDDPAPLVGALAGQGLRAKIRTGGTTADAFPPAASVVRFLASCVRAKLPFKATAGLHHPLRGEYRLTYDAGSPAGPMFGFLNVFLAAALLRDGGSVHEAEELLMERDAGAMTFDDDGARWHGHLMLTARLAQLRDRAAISFGSCSFAEPVGELSAMGLV